MFEHKTFELIEQLSVKHKDLLSVFDPFQCIRELDEIPDRESYHFLSDVLLTRCAAITSQFGEDGFEAFQKLTMLRLIEDFPKRLVSSRFTDNIRHCFEKSFSRIIQSIEDPKYRSYRSNNDIFLKDLALCRLKMFPAGAQVIESNSSFHRALMFSGGVNQAFRMLKLLLTTGGNANWLQIHTHLSELEDFNLEGWDRCYLRIAEMLTIHPNCRGMWGGSWFYDPALEEISPRLSYLRKRPQENGALVFYSNDDPHGGALATSKTRQDLNRAGKYFPKSYALIWPRRQLISWAKKSRSLGDTDRLLG